VGKRFLWILLAAIAGALVWYSQTNAFAWDEGFHILTAQLILHGKRPYIDFVFSQTPLNAFWNALWMAILGETWRVPHAMAALASAGATVLTARFVLTRFPDVEWRLPGAFVAAILTGLNVLVFRFGGIAQAYGLCLLLLMAAYCSGVLAVERNSVALTAAAGFFCGAAASASLLTAPAGPIMLIWLAYYRRTWRTLAAYAAGAVVAFSPVLWLIAHGPQQVWFGIVDYNLLYRMIDWPSANQQNLEVALSWIDSGHALLLLALAVAGIIAVHEPEFRLCGWLVAGLGIYIAIAVRPTFERYFVFTVPFLAILAVAGLRSFGQERRWMTVAVVAFLVAVGLGRELYFERDDAVWRDYEETARKVQDVTPPNATLYADEAIYFLTKHVPPSGMEMQNSHKFDFPPEKLAQLHLLPQEELDRRVKAGLVDTLETCEDDDFIEDHGYAQVYGNRAEAGECTVFWNSPAISKNQNHAVAR
jgi:hypothetical protein